jgi:putative ABC transport system permease protein
MNLQTDDDINSTNGIIASIIANSPNNVIKVAVDTPYIILGSGITPDFTYPAFSLSKMIPNQVNECIFFSNSAGFSLLSESFRSNPYETYYVVKFKGSVNKDILNQINT